jgi:hypothetical protein
MIADSIARQKRRQAWVLMSSSDMPFAPVEHRLPKKPSLAIPSQVFALFHTERSPRYRDNGAGRPFCMAVAVYRRNSDHFSNT